jgi:tetratricopeptide (TPR) repeat protein
LVSTALGFALTARAERPLLLVAQIFVGKEDANLNLDAVLADELDRVGQVTPVIWSMTDPLVRSLDAEGKFAFSPVRNEEDAVFKARLVDAKYLLLVVATRRQSTVLPYAKLVRPGTKRPLWTYNQRDWDKEKPTPDEKIIGTYREFSVEVEGTMDWDTTARSIARSWAQSLANEGLRGIPRSPRPDTSDPNPYQGPGLLIPTGQTNDVTDVPPALREAALRDAIDREPERVELRGLLFDEQVRNMDYPGAALTAENAARWDGSDSIWKLRSAYANALAGNIERASALATVVPEASLAEPRNAAMLGEVMLASGEYGRAVEAFTRSIQVRPSPEALVGRAVALALSGQREASVADLKAVTDAPGPRALAGYRLAVGKFQQAADRLVASVKALIPLAAQNHDQPETLARAATLASKTDALAAAVTALVPPEMHKRSHALLGLACNLLGQSSQEVLELAKSGSPDREGQALDSLREAEMQLPDQRAIFRDEVLTASSSH